MLSDCNVQAWQQLTFLTTSDDYGADEQGLATEDSEGVTVPAIDVNISEENLRLLQQQINPLHDDGNYGINIYEETLAFISRI